MNLRDAQTLALDLMGTHGLTAKGWTFKYYAKRCVFGTCYYRTKTIALSRPLTACNELETVRDTILHEIAHALMPGAGHGPVWQLQAIAIGAKPEACKLAHEIVMPRGKLVATCPGCRTEYHRYTSRPPKRRKACGRCCNGTFQECYELIFK